MLGLLFDKGLGLSPKKLTEEETTAESFEDNQS